MNKVCIKSISLSFLFVLGFQQSAQAARVRLTARQFNALKNEFVCTLRHSKLSRQDIKRLQAITVVFGRNNRRQAAIYTQLLRRKISTQAPKKLVRKTKKIVKNVPQKSAPRKVTPKKVTTKKSAPKRHVQKAPARKPAPRAVVQTHAPAPRLVISAAQQARDLHVARVRACQPLRDRLVAAGVQECPICIDDINDLEFVELSCGHIHCRNCINAVLDNALRARAVVNLRCPERGCNAILNEQDIRVITDGDGRLAAYTDIASEEWASTQPGYKHCRTANCGYYFFKEAGGGFMAVDCPQCHRRYCSDCCHPHEAGTTCAQAAHDAELASDPTRAGNASAAWINEHTKPCPHCHTQIEKNEGCNHMTCIHCHHEFCWLCSRPWMAPECQYFGERCLEHVGHQ